MALERIAVIGAGLAGLSAALELHEAGMHVDLFERSRLLGGRATSFEVGGHEVDNGQHVFLGCCTEFIRFAERVGMAGALRLQARFDARILARDGRESRLRAGSFPAPFTLAESFAGYGHLGFTDKLRVARALVRGARQVSGATATFAQWLDRNGQNAQTRRAFWDPFFIPALNAPFERVSARDALFVLRTAFMEGAAAARFGFSEVPLAHLAAAAAGRLDAVHLATGVAGLEVRPGDVGVRLLDGSVLSFDGVVLAVPPPQAARILGEPARYGVAHLASYDAFPIVDVHLWHDGGGLGFDFAAALDSPLQWIFEKAPGYLCCSCSAADEYMREPTAALEALAWGEVQAFLPQLRKARRTGSAVTRNPEATWLPRVGASRTAQATASPRLTIAGGWTDTGWPDTMESAVRSGATAAQKLFAIPARGEVTFVDA